MEQAGEAEAGEGGAEAGRRPGGPLRALRAVMSPSVALGFGLFWAWKSALSAFMFPPSEGLVFSPLVCMSFSSCLVLLVALLAAVKNRASFPARIVRVAGSVLVALATLAGVFVTHGWGGLGAAYVGSAVIGCAAGALLYAWADIVSGLPEAQRLGTAVAGICAASLLQVLNGLLSWFSLDASIAVLGALAFVGLLHGSGRLVGRPEEPLMFRPARSSHFRMLAASLVLYAFVFGGVSGVTAAHVTAPVMNDFVTGTSWALFLISLAALAALAAWGRPVRLRTVGYLLAPVLVTLLLLHIPFQGSLGGWLPKLTLGLWEYVQAFALLLLIDLAKSGLASLSFTFPVGWAFLSLGHALGALFGQSAGVLFGDAPAAVQTVSVVFALVAVYASTAMGAARYPSPGGFLGTPGGQAVPGGPGASVAECGTGAGAGRAAGAGALPAPPDPIAAACSQLVERYALSSREREVLELLARGNTRASIAEKLCISENTARVHVKNIYSKLRIHSKQQLIDMVERRS